MPRVRVAIYGGGVGGLSIAHELAKFGSQLQIDVYESENYLGGKAASQYLKGTGQGGRHDLPGEHGFRFFPAFYFHLDTTMGEIPCGHGRRVSDNLVGSESFAVARNGRRPAVAQRRVGRDVDSVAGAIELLSAWFSQDALGLSSADLSNLVFAVTKFMMSSDARRREEYDHLSWYQFSGASADIFSDSYRSLVSNLPRTMVAMDGKNGSAYTIGKAGSQLFFLDPLRTDGGVDRVLNGPTSETWLRPWEEHLRRLGVRFHHGAPLERLSVDEQDGHYIIDRAQLAGGRSVVADYHICALPLEAMMPLVDGAIAGVSPNLRKAKAHLTGQTAWMVGAQYFLKRDIRVAHGHVIYPDSPWALSSISQAQFWQPSGGRIDERYGDGSTKGILSVDISNWDAAAPRLGRTAKQCTREEILDETFRQIMDGLNHSRSRTISWEDVTRRHLDGNVKFSEVDGKVSTNSTPLLVHAPGTYQYRPSSSTGVRNLFVVSDYVATHTNLATMEGANEAARRASRRILADLGLCRTLPEVRDLPEPAIFEPFKKLDAWLLRQGQGFEQISQFREIELVELIDAAHRLSNEVSIPAMRRSLGWVRTMSGRSSRAAVRIGSSLGQMASALGQADRLRTRRSVLTPRAGRFNVRRRRPASGPAPTSVVPPPRQERLSERAP